jgi:hypothetical protein
MQRSLAMGLGLTLAVPLVAFPLWISVYSKDLADAGDADLAVEAAEVADGANAWSHLERASQLARLPEGDAFGEVVDYARGDRTDPTLVESLVKKNARAFKELEAAVDSPELVYPSRGSGDTLGAAVRLAVLARAEGRRLTKAGDVPGALAQDYFALRLGKRLADAHNPGVVEMMSALMAERSALAGLADTVFAQSLDAEQVAAAVRELDAARIPAERWARSWAVMYQWHKEGLLAFKASADGLEGVRPDAFIRPMHKYVSTYTYQPVRTASYYAADAREWQRRYSAPCTKETSLDLHHASRERVARGALRGNFVGEYIHEIDSLGLPIWNARRCHIETLNSLVRTQLAMRAYHRDRHAVPESLESLVPEYLPAVPVDAFGGAPLRFNRPNRVLYSIGGDFRDDSGRSQRRSEDTAEPSVSVAFD